MMQRRDYEVQFDISLYFDESYNKMEVTGISGERLTEEKNRSMNEIPGA